uniref:ubiquitinyl hydrolase 1 n=1 Tax=Lepisosteus oculatus TaxID=7918 RepID=W5N6A2_LEPOC
MASTTEAAGCRRPSRGPEDSTSKKKQKDKANQESKEAKRASSLETKKDVFYDWKQNANEVIVKLKPGEGVMKVEDVDAGFSDTACQVKFPDGRLWSCHLHAEIESSCSKVQYKEKGSFLQLVMQKKIPFNAWPSLMRSKKNKDPVQIQTESGKQLPPKVEKLDAEMGKAPVESMEQKRAKVERGLKRAIKAKPSEKSDLGAKMPEAAKPTEKTEPPAEPSAKRTFCTVKTAKDPGLSSGRDSPAKGSEKSQTETSSEAACPLSCNGRSRHKRSDRGPPAALLQERRADSQHMGKSQAVVLEERRGQSVVTEIGSDVLGPPSGGTLNPPTVPCSSGDSEKSDSLDGTVEPAVQVDRETAMIPEVEKRVPELGMVGLDHVGAGEPASIALTEEAGASGTSTEEKRDRCKEETLENQAEVLEPMVNLTFVKNDSYEKGNDFMVVNVYLKGIHRETVKVLFREQDFTLIFQTSDPSFLRLQPGCGPNTVFKWQVKLRNLIHPDQCTYAFTPSRIDITLKKRHSQRWGGLEAPATQGAVGGAKVAVPTGPASLDKSQPGSSQHALPSKEEPRTAEKDKTRAEDSALDTVGDRTVPEHVPIKQEPLVTSPKPTCMVPPMTHASAGSEHTAEEEEKKVCLPGFTGLVNLGNTCFMNSVIQSLSNTRELRDYFHDRAFETEINCSNPLGTGGRLAIGFAVLLRALWKGTHHAFQPSKLKAIVASKASQFTGYAQHDAQEFMAFLLDGLHEDLNRIQNKPYTETVDSDGRQDEVVAEEAWQRHKMRNDSFIVDLFQGQYKSKLVCPVCSKVSITFDPFLYLPVPLPQKQKVLTVFYFGKEPHKKPVKFLVSVSKENSSTAEVLESISRSVRVKPENLRLAEVIKSRFHRIFLPSHSLDAVSPSDTLFCFEVLSKELAKEKVLVLQVQQRPLVPSIPIAKCAACQKPPQSQEEKVKRCTRCYRVGYCNHIAQLVVLKSLSNVCCNTSYISYNIIDIRFKHPIKTCFLSSRYSVSVFQPPFQTGRMSPEVSQCRADLPPETLDSSCQESVLAQEAEKEGPSLSSEPHTNSEQPPGNSVEEPDSMTSLTTDSGFSAPVPETQDSVLEKETSCEKTVKPEAAVTGYQQPPESQAHSASQFYISLIDSANKEQRLEDKGDAVLEIAEDCSLVLVWKNNERQKEYVLIKSKELEFVEDPGSASEAARAGHFTLEQCLNLFTKPEVLAPEEAWYCPKCKQHREASKQLMLWRLPNVLIIQLKHCGLISIKNIIWNSNEMNDFVVVMPFHSKVCQREAFNSGSVLYILYSSICPYELGFLDSSLVSIVKVPEYENIYQTLLKEMVLSVSFSEALDHTGLVLRYMYCICYRFCRSAVAKQPNCSSLCTSFQPREASSKSLQASSQALFETDLDTEGPPQLTPEVASDLFPHPGDCTSPSYSNIKDVD